MKKGDIYLGLKIIMKTLTLKEFTENPDGIIKRVEKGEKIAVTDGEISAVLVSSDEYLYQLHTNHEQGS